MRRPKVTPGVVGAFMAVTVLAVLSALSPPRMLIFGVLAVGPALAAATASPPLVLVIGAYAGAAALAISTWQGMFGSPDQILRLLTVAVVTAIGWLIARHLRALLTARSAATGEREMLGALVEQSADAIIVTDLAGTVRIWNAGAEKMYGYQASEVIGHRFTKILPAERLPVFEHAQAILATGEHLRLDESRRFRKDGSEIVVSVTVAPIRDDSGRVVATAATERDITTQKRLEAEEKLAMERSARAKRMESLGQLAGGVAHDFNNLLAIILNYADFLTDEVTAKGDKDLARIRNAAERARDLTGQLLLFAKREPTQVETVDLNEVVGCSGELLRRSIAANIQLVCRRQPEPLPVRANRGHLDQILLNLIVNARDAMPDGGVVVMETDQPSGGNARLTVSDTGCGMTAEVRDRLFEPFFTTKPADQGTGLGLATVYGIVTDAGGQISVDSSPGVGTTFQILLPLAPEPADRVPDVDDSPANGHGEHVVVIDDEEHVRDLVVRILEQNGYRATVWLNGSPPGDEPDDVALLVTDIVLPGRSGPAIAERLRVRHPELPVLFMSGYGDDDLRRRYDLDSARIVQKPFTAVELLAAVGDALSGETLDQQSRDSSSRVA
ncbi:PAS domain S-box protein [Actinoplanes hulinensis]|uniref:histidine kinase n=1 Tax=Actinoplanes hulinensis TaxID=1144547 RepID=A0ABS7B7S2_9ACTN|nr:PAS domain-containing sensor histidine kinase [Actinoplanes hulinensis]MBW6437013.1 PAS domain S-box protein [Actinoplanes hulinensis]